MQRNHCGVQIHMHEPLMKKLAYCSKIMVPIYHYNEFHFTLLCIKITEKKCFHLDPKRASGDELTARCLAHAVAVVSYNLS